MTKTVRKVLKEKANDFTEKLVKFIRDTEWELSSETTAIDIKKLEKTKITLKFDISKDALEEIRTQVNTQKIKPITTYGSDKLEEEMY